MLNRLLSVKEYAPGETDRKAWEVAIALEALAAGGCIRPDAVILGVGAGFEPTIFHLSTRVKQVIATDLYESPGVWSDWCPTDMLTNPAKFAPAGVAYDLDRIDVRHMDGRALVGIEDESVDGVFSSGSIEHFGTWDDIAQAAREIGRVLKPGGLASISTEFKVNAMPGDGWEGVMLFDREKLFKYLVEPSGLALYDNPGLDGLHPDPATIATTFPLHDMVVYKKFPPVSGMLLEHGYQFTSVHIALVKPPKARRAKKGT